MQTVLVVGEGERTREVARELEGAGYEVNIAPATDASPLLTDSPPCAAVVDLATASGFCRIASNFRAGGLPSLGVLPEEMLNSDALADSVDDFAVYPLRGRELVIRLCRLLNRSPIPNSSSVIHYGRLAIDTAGYGVYVDRRVVRLTFREFELLRFLADHRERVCTRELLLDRVWGYNYFGGTRTVDTHIRRLRGKIEADGCSFIETVRSVGYRFRPSTAAQP